MKSKNEIEDKLAEKKAEYIKTADLIHRNLYKRFDSLTMSKHFNTMRSCMISHYNYTWVLEDSEEEEKHGTMVVEIGVVPGPEAKEKETTTKKPAYSEAEIKDKIENVLYASDRIVIDLYNDNASILASELYTLFTNLQTNEKS